MLRTIQFLFVIVFFGAFASCQEKKEDLMQEARTAMQAQDNQKAISILTKLLEIDANNAEALNMRGVANINLDNFEFAVADFDKAITIDPNNYKYYYNSANIKRTINQNMGAIEDYSKALALDSSHYELWFARAQCYAAVEKDVEALSDLAGATRHGGAKDAGVHFLRGQILTHLEQYGSAIKSLEMSLVIKKDDAEAYYWLGKAQLKDAKDAACASFKKSSELGFEEANHALEDHCK